MLSRTLLLSLWFSTNGVFGQIQLTVPKTPPVGTQVLNGPFQGYSMEMADFPKIAGNLSSPNLLSIQLLQNLEKITGSPPPIRIGGTTANHATWIASQDQAIVKYYAVQGADQPANVTLGPKYLESFKTFPASTQYVVGLTFNDGIEGERETISAASAFYQGIGSNLYAFEIGNEFDIFPVDRNKSTWSIQKYVPEWVQRVAAVSRALGVNKIFQSGVFVVPGLINNDTSWTAQTALDLGVTASGQAKTYCTHQYFGAACGPVKPTLGGSIMNRTNIQTYMKYHASASAYTMSKGIPYVIGETNSIACQGLTGVSDVFGAALWSVDYALYAASQNVSQLDWHMGVGYRYAAWQAVQNGTTTPGPRPLYYGNWFVAAAIGGPGKQVVQVANEKSFAAYAIYTAAGVKWRARLESVVIVNMNLYNSTAQSDTGRPSIAFTLPQILTNAKAYRLTAPGAESRSGIVFAGTVIDDSGKFIGERNAEAVVDGVIAALTY